MALDWNITRAVRLRLADGLRTPVTAGWLRPIVLLPTSLVTGLPPELLEALLAHELAHIRRFDYLVNLGQNLIETVLFYHPAVWWISRQIRIEREQIADDLATSYLGAPRQLALALSELEKFSYSEPRLVMAANGGELATRIRRLLQPQHAASGWISLVPVLALTAGCLAMVVHAQPAGTQPVTVKARAMFSSCKKPVYPAESLRAGHTGTVVLNFLITSNGKVRESAVASSSGHLALDAAARDGISLCEFTPASRDGKPIDSWVRVQYVWMLS